MHRSATACREATSWRSSTRRPSGKPRRSFFRPSFNCGSESSTWSAPNHWPKAAACPAGSSARPNPRWKKPRFACWALSRRWRISAWRREPPTFPISTPTRSRGGFSTLAFPPEIVPQLDGLSSPSNLFPLRSPLDGIVVECMVVPGEVVDTTATIFGVADVREMWLMLDVLREDPRAIVVPSEAVHWDSCCNIVFVRDKNYFQPDAPKFFHIRKVRLGVQDGGTTEIIAGLLPGEVIASKNSVVLEAQLLKSNLGAGCASCAAPKK